MPLARCVAGERLEKNYVRFVAIGKNRAVKRSPRERGEGRAKAIIYTAIFLLVIYAAWKVVPAYVSEYQLADKMQEQARFAVVNRYTDEQIRENVYKVVQDLDIQGVKREDIKVIASPSDVKITLDYTVPVDLLVYHAELHFSPSSENKSVM